MDFPDHQGMTVRRYLATRLLTLKPPLNRPPNPFKVIRAISRMQWSFFLVAFCAWVSEPSLTRAPSSHIVLTHRHFLRMP